MENDEQFALIEALLINKDANVRAIYEEVLTRLEEIGTYQIEVKKTSLHLIKKTAFLGLHPKKKWLDINIVTTHPLEHELVTKVEQVSKNRFHNNLRLTALQQIDAQVMAFFKEAYNR